jgi:hypothetical protein
MFVCAALPLLYLRLQAANLVCQARSEKAFAEKQQEVRQAELAAVGGCT